MKKFMLGLFVLASLTLTTSCSSDDDSGSSNLPDELKVTVEGEIITLEVTYIDEEVVNGVTELSVEAEHVEGDLTTSIMFEIDIDGTSSNDFNYFYMDFEVTGEDTISYGNCGGATANNIVRDGTTTSFSFSGSLGDCNSGSLDLTAGIFYGTY